MGRREGFASIASLAALLSCASLSETIPDNQCGNGIVELGAGEDCDTISDPAHGRTCGRAGTPTACRLECDRDPTKGKGCPDGWGCGADGICREPSGAFDLRGGGIASDATTLAAADFNGDGVWDVAAGGPSGIDVYSAPLAGTVTAFDIPAKSAQPIVGALSGGSNADLLFVAGARVSVFRGRPDGTLSPQAYPTLSFPSDGSSLRMFPIEAQPRQPGKEILTYVKSRLNDTFEIQRAGADVAEPNAPNITYVKGLRASQYIAGDILVGRFVDDDTGCEQFLLGFRGDPALELYFPCKRDAANAVVPNDVDATSGVPTRAPLELDLPPATMLAAADFTNANLPDPDDANHQKTLYRAGDYEGDGDLDLYVQVTDSTGGETRNVLLRNDAGTFTIVELGSSEFQDVGVAAVPLAFGQLTSGDRYTDYVGPHGALLVTAGPAVGDAGAGPGSGQLNIVPSGDHVWTEAQIADFNADGIPDFAAASSDGVDVFRGTAQNLFGGFPLETPGPAGKLAYGDLDADGAMDLVFRVQQVDPVTQQRDDAVDVAFGRLHGGPVPPVEVGRFGKAEQVQSAVTGVFGPADGFADIGVYSKSGNASRQNVSFVTGSPDRLLTAPFAVTKTQPGSNSTNVTQTLGVAVAELTGDGHPDLAALVVNRNDAGGPTAANVTFGYELWVVPVTGDAELDQATLVPATGPLEMGTAATAELVRTRWGWDEAQLAAIDVRPEPAPAVDEIAILVPPLVAALDAPAHGKGQVMLAQVDPTTKALTALGSPVGLGWLQLPVDGAGVPTVLRAKADWKLRAADIDDDGATDLVMIVDEQAGRRLELLFNHRDGTVDAATTVVELPNGAIARDVTVANVDGDKEKELVVLTDKGVYVAKVTRGDGPPATATRSVAVTGPVISATDAAGAVAIVAGDFDGDRIDDIALSGGGTLKSFKGRTVLP